MVRLDSHPGQGSVLWFTGLSGAGKTTLCHIVAQSLEQLGHRVCIIDGDDLRTGLSADLGFTDEDRVENIRRAAHLARFLSNNGTTVLVALISPSTRGRTLARTILPFLIQVFVDSPIEVCEARDPKNLYKMARLGLLSNFTGIHSLYEPPTHPDIVCKTNEETIEQSAAKVLQVFGSATLTSSIPEIEQPENQVSRRNCIAVDFDGTLADYGGWKGEESLGPIRQDVLRVLRILRERGWKILIHTTRSAENVSAYLRNSDVPFDEVNTNTDYSNLGTKPVATIYWDDRALRYSGDAEADLENILAFRTWSGRR